MSAALGLDRTGQLSHSSGVITLNVPPGQSFNVITIGGQQYRTASLFRTISADVTLLENTLYMVFAVVSGGVVSLRISSNFNSVGPVGFTAWQLVGAFYSDGASLLGSFLNPNTEPETEWISFTSPLQNFTVSSQNCRWKRLGEDIFTRFFFALNAAPTGTIYFRQPVNIPIFNGAKFDYTSNDGHLGTATANPGVAQNYQGHLQPSSLDGRWRIVGDGGANEWSSSGAVPFAWASGNRFSATTYPIPIVGWLNTPLKDL